MQKIELKYRVWGKGISPRPIRLQIPGWAGDDREHGNGAKPQPWHCLPFVEAATYGLELVYPFDTESRVVNDGELKFLGDFSAESVPGAVFPPFQKFSENHYGYTSSVDIQVPDEYILRVEPHPRFYTDTTGTVPVPVPGHLQTQWWSKIFFVVFKSPRPGETHVFRKGEPYAQVLVLPKKSGYCVAEMTPEEKYAREKMDAAVSDFGREISCRRWRDHAGNVFDDKYKILKRAYEANGVAGVERVIRQARDKKGEKTSNKRAAIGRYVPVKKDES